MSTIDPVDPSTAPAAVHAILDPIERATGAVPTALLVLANSPAALQAWWDFERAIARGTLRAALREQLALLTAATNRCDHCVALHTTAAGHVGLTPTDVELALEGRAHDPLAQAALDLATAVLAARGPVDGAELASARAAGLTDAQVLEVLAVVAINTFNNTYNLVARTPVGQPSDAPGG